MLAVVPCFSLTWTAWLQLIFASALSDLLHQFIAVMQHLRKSGELYQSRHFLCGAIPLENKHTKPLLVGEKPKAEAPCYSVRSGEIPWVHWEDYGATTVVFLLELL